MAPLVDTNLFEQTRIEILESGAMENIPAGGPECAQSRQRPRARIEEIRNLAVSGPVVVHSHWSEHIGVIRADSSQTPVHSRRDSERSSRLQGQNAI
jgi:hypothetical protein